MKYQIKARFAEQKYHNAMPVHGTGEPTQLNSVLELFAVPLSKDVVKYSTGLSPDDYTNNPKLSEISRKAAVETLERLAPIIEKKYGKAPFDSTNTVFWDSTRTHFPITKQTLLTEFDTDDADDAILYMNILSGGYGNISPSLEESERKSGTSFYLTTAEEHTQKVYEQEFGSKLEAMAALHELMTKKSNEAWVYMTYSLGDDKLKGYTKNTSKAQFEKTFVEFIEGKYSKTDKKKQPKKFLDTYNSFKAGKEVFIGKAIISVSHYFGFIEYDKNNKRYYLKSSKLELGNNLEQAYKTLQKPENASDWESLMDEVETKLNK